MAVSCGSATNCVAVGQRGTVISTSDSGTSWTAQSYDDIRDFSGISCADAQTCFAIGRTDTSGRIVATTNGGKTWTSLNYGGKEDHRVITCPTPLNCFALTEQSKVRTTSDGGKFIAARNPVKQSIDSLPTVERVARQSIENAQKEVDSADKIQHNSQFNHLVY